MRNFIACALILLTFSAVSGQQDSSISGTVVTADEMPAGKATIILKLRSDNLTVLTTQADDKGRFRIENLRLGRYVLWAYYGDGDRLSTSANVDLTQNRSKIVALRVTDAASVMRFHEIVTVSAGESQPIEQVSKTVNVITAQELRDRADFSLADTLRTIPGFRVQQLGGFGRTATIKTRGLRNQDTAILIDGIRFRDVSAITGDSSPFLSDFTLTSVAKVEVLRGSGSSLYGTNAVGGTIDFQTPTVRTGTHGQISGAFGGLGLGRFRGNLSHGTSDSKFGVSGGVSRTFYTEGIDGQDNAANTNFQSRVEFNPFTNTNISARFFVSDASVRLNSSPDTFGTMPLSNAIVINANPNVNFVADANDPDSFQKSKFFSGQLALNQVINSKLVISGYYQGLTTKRTNDNGALGAGFQSASTSIFDGTINTGNVHLNWTPVKENELIVGYEFEKEKYGNDGRTPSGTGNFFTKAGQTSNTIYVQDLVRLLEGNLQLAGGIRVQQYSLDRPSFSLANAPYNSLGLENPPTAYTFDGSASYFISKTGTKFRAHVGNGYRVPSLYERMGTFFSSFGTPSFIALGDPFLKPEKTIAFDAGVEQDLAKNKVRLTATYFYTKLTDVIGYGNVVPNIGSTPRPFGGYLNQKGGIARGGEFSVTVKPTSSTDIFTSYTYTNSDQIMPQVSGSGVNRTLGVPTQQFTLVATQRYKRFWVNFDLLATSDYLAPIFSNATFATYVYRFAGNRKGDLTAGYTFGFKNEKITMRLFGTVENVLDQEYYENGFRTSKATGRVGLAFGF
ncbi:MAG: TonB-dependent receptor [Acidobacteria bacterium]|nr:TonB-dependent receptor [Acidobacteriota bacterium]